VGEPAVLDQAAHHGSALVQGLSREAAVQSRAETGRGVLSARHRSGLMAKWWAARLRCLSLPESPEDEHWCWCWWTWCWSSSAAGISLPTGPSTQTISQPLTAARAEIRLSTTLGRLDIGLTPEVPLVLTVETGVGKSTLNLEDLRVTDLSLNVGVGQATVQLPATGMVKARIGGGVGQVAVTFPRRMGARVEVGSGTGRITVEQAGR
jgi:hypothetical protein